MWTKIQTLWFFLTLFSMPLTMFGWIFLFTDFNFILMLLWIVSFINYVVYAKIRMDGEPF